jgi:hypothetical protein
MIVSFLAFLAFAILEPNPIPFLSIFLIGVLFLVVLVCCFACVVPDVCFEYKIKLLFGSLEDKEYQRARAEEHKSSFCWRKTSGLLLLHILFYPI